MADFQQQALTLTSQQKSPAWLAALRSQAANDWQNVQWPTRKTEHWKYTSLASLQKTSLSLVNNSAANTDWKSEVEFIDVDAIRLVFVNGVLMQSIQLIYLKILFVFHKLILHSKK